MSMLKKILVAALLASAGLGMPGCEQALFPEDLPRTPFERYDRLRGVVRPSKRQNRFGGAQPAISERLQSESY